MKGRGKQPCVPVFAFEVSKSLPATKYKILFFYSLVTGLDPRVGEGINLAVFSLTTTTCAGKFIPKGILAGLLLLVRLPRLP